MEKYGNLEQRWSNEDQQKIFSAIKRLLDIESDEKLVNQVRTGSSFFDKLENLVKNDTIEDWKI